MIKHRLFHDSASSNRAGFTLTELIIVVLLVGITSTMILIAFGRNTEEERLKAASKVMIEYLKTTLIHARQTRQSCTVSIDHASKEVAISNPNTCQNRPSINLLDSVEGLSALKICGSSTISNTQMACNSSVDGSDAVQGTPRSTTQVVFTPRGSISQGALLKLYSTKAKRARCIAITQPIGLIREGQQTPSGCDFTGA